MHHETFVNNSPGPEQIRIGEFNTMLRMFTAYKYLFYRMLRWAKAVNPDNVPEWTAMLSASFLPLMNLGTMTLIYALLTGERSPLPLDGLFKQILFLAAYAYFNYLILLRGGRSEIISRSFEGETPKLFMKRGRMVVLYIVLTFVLMFTSMLLLAWLNGQR